MYIGLLLMTRLLTATAYIARAIMQTDETGLLSLKDAY